MLAPWKKSNDQPRQSIKKQRYYFANKDPMVFLVVMCQCFILEACSMAFQRARVRSILAANSVGFVAQGKLHFESGSLRRVVILTMDSFSADLPSSWGTDKWEPADSSFHSALDFVRLCEAGERQGGKGELESWGEQRSACVSRTLACPSWVQSNPLWTLHLPPSSGLVAMPQGHGATRQWKRLLPPLGNKRTGQPAQLRQEERQLLEYVMCFGI